VILQELCRQHGIELWEGHAKPDDVHQCLSIPPKHNVANTIGFLKGKSGVRIHRELLGERRMTGLHFWAAGYCVSAVDLDEARVRPYIREQDEQDRRQGELKFE
jgi:putative transposase